jgi:branched-chain amino acid transport system substrate-binding protein
LQAQSSGANVVGMALAGQDMVNAIKGAHEFGLPQGGQKIAAMVLFITDVQGVGLNIMGGTYVTTAFYWDLDDETRAFARRFQEKMGRPPTMVQAGDYSAVNHYLKAVKAAGTTQATVVAAKMRELTRGRPTSSSRCWRIAAQEIEAAVCQSLVDSLNNGAALRGLLR